MMRDIGIIFGIWLISQGIIIPFTMFDEYPLISILIDIGSLVLLYVIFFGLKLIGVDATI